MEIEGLENVTDGKTLLKDIEPGKCFVLAGKIYMRVAQNISDPNRSSPAVNLTTGELFAGSAGRDVKAINAKIVAIP